VALDLKQFNGVILIIEEGDKMKNKICSILFTVFFVIGCSTQLFAQDYDHEVNAKGITFSWKIEGSDLKVKISAETTGWVGIGFNATDKMKDGNFILGYVKNGKAEIIDDYGVSKNGHKDDDKIGGTNNATLIGGTEQGGKTTIEFSIPLNSGDKMDTVIDPAGETVVLLAYGGSRDSFISKHKDRASIKVNLTTGKVI
jgi:hypothetical protein